MKSRILELYGGEAPSSSGGDQETREEYEARKRAGKKKKKKETAAAEESKPRVIQTVLRVIDASEAPFSVPSQLEQEEEEAVKKHTAGGLVADDVQQTRRRQRVDSSSSSDSDLPARGRSGRRQRVRSSSSDSEAEPSSSLTKRKQRQRISSSSSSSDDDERGHVEVDSDGDVRVSRRAMRRRRASSTSSSSSSSSEEGPSIRSMVGLKGKDEFAEAMAAQGKTSTLTELDEFALGKGQTTVYRDKKTGEVKTAESVKQRTLEEINQENEILRYELNMGALDKLHLKGIIQTQKDDNLIEEDPMAKFFKKDTAPEDELTLTGKPRYKGRAPLPNRFQIPPGYRWDGVDRSNGFEARLLRKRDQKVS